jgi:putative endonuclease
LSADRTSPSEDYRVDVLQNAAGRLYIGLTDDINRRVAQHNFGVSRWTRGKGPWRLVWNSETMTLSAARKLETSLKRQKGGVGLWRTIGASRAGS